MKTIEHERKVYQVGTVYEFSVDGEDWGADILEDIHRYSRYPYETRSGINFKFIRACEASLGTITDAPVKLIDGECYQYTDRCGIEQKGLFVAEYGIFYRAGHWSDDVNGCSNIKLLVVENSNEQI